MKSFRIESGRPTSLQSGLSCILLHAGGPKTGTDSIQRCFGYYAANNFKWIADDFELLKPVDFNTSNLSSITHRIEQDHTQAITISREGFITKQKLSKGFAELNEKHYVFSSEQAGRPSLTPDRAKKQYEYLRYYCDQPRVLYYMRDPMSQCLSLITQIIKEGLDYHKVLPQFLKGQPNMRNVLTFDALYGTSNVMCVPFDPSKFRNNSILYDFCDRLGMTDDKMNISSFLERFNNTNNSPPLNLLCLLRDIYKRLNMPQNTRMHFLNALSDVSLAGPKAVLSDFLSSEQIARLSDLYVNEHDELGAYLGFEPYALNLLFKGEPCELTMAETEHDYTYNANELFSAAERIRIRLEKHNLLNNDVMQRPPLSNLGPVRGAGSLSEFLDSVDNIRLKNCLSPKIMCEASLDYLVNLSHIWAEYKRCGSGSGVV